MITFQEEKFSEVKKESLPLLVDHWKEVGTYDKDKIPLKPIWEWYKIFEEKKLLYILTVRKDTKLIGYCTFIMTPHIHHADARMAECDLIYLSPEHRKGLLGYKLLKNAIEVLKYRVQIISISMKLKHLFIPIAERLGFKLTDYKFTLEV